MVRAQMKIQQTAFMLIAVTLFFVLVGLFFLGFKLSGYKEDVNYLKEKQAKQLVSKLANSPEFMCGSSFNNKYSDCVDADKVLLLMQNSSNYRNFWGVDDIKIRRIYPKINGEVACNVANYPNCNIFNIISDETIGTYYSNFISLCRKEKKGGGFYNKCEVAILMVSYEKIT